METPVQALSGCPSTKWLSQKFLDTERAPPPSTDTKASTVAAC